MKVIIFSLGQENYRFSKEIKYKKKLLHLSFEVITQL